MRKRIQHFFNRLRHADFATFPAAIRRSRPYRRTEAFAQRRPFMTFLLGLGILLLVIALGNFLSSLQRKPEVKPEITKSVQVYDLNGVPSVTMQAKVDKSGVIQILAQSAGIVQQVHAKEGSQVSKGQTLVSLSSNYQGGNAPALQYQLANVQYKNVQDTFDIQKDIISKQRDVANKTEENAEELRRIASDSADDTRSLLQMNEDTLDTINANLTNLENAPVPNAQLQAEANQAKGQLEAAIVQLKAQLRQLDYQRDTDKPAAELGRLQKDIALKQLDIQEKALSLSLESSRIQRDLAGVAASLMTPATPCSGTVERVFVKPGDAVSPGTPLAIIKTGNTEVTLEVLVPADIAAAVSQTQLSTIHLTGGETVRLAPYYVSREATSGSLYSVLYSLNDAQVASIADAEYLPVTIPIGYKLSGAVPYVPLDAVYQTEREAYVFVVAGQTAVSRKVVLGDVYGKFVTVTRGLRSTDQVILNRNIVAGEKISVAK